MGQAAKKKDLEENKLPESPNLKLLKSADLEASESIVKHSSDMARVKETSTLADESETISFKDTLLNILLSLAICAVVGKFLFIKFKTERTSTSREIASEVQKNAMKVTK